MKRCLAILTGAAVLHPAPMLAQEEAAGEQQAVELYQGPRVVAPATPEYPAGAAMESKEGWVMLNFMVDPEGHPYEIRVIERAGDESFVSAARRALERSEFGPARLGDQTVDGSASLTYRFVMEDGAAGASSRFASRYRRFVRALEERSEADAAEQLTRLADKEHQRPSESSAGEGFGLGVSVVTDPVARRCLVSKGSFGWSGFYGTYFWVDPQEELVALLMVQTYDNDSWFEFESVVMQALVV